MPEFEPARAACGLGRHPQGRACGCDVRYRYSERVSFPLPLTLRLTLFFFFRLFIPRAYLTISLPKECPASGLVLASVVLCAAAAAAAPARHVCGHDRYTADLEQF